MHGIYAFQLKITQYTKENIPWAMEIKYFSNGGGGVKLLHFLVTILINYQDFCYQYFLSNYCYNC